MRYRVLVLTLACGILSGCASSRPSGAGADAAEDGALGLEVLDLLVVEDAEVAAAIDAFAHWLEGQGHLVTPVRLPFRRGGRRP